jgi:arylsulfatase A-like enzyme
MKRLTAGSLALVALAAVGCGRQEKVVVYDLVRATPAAEADFPWEYLAFGTLAARPFQEKGFAREVVEPFSDSHAVTHPKSQVLLRWGEVVPRLAVIDVAPYRGATGASAAVVLNGTTVGRLVLKDGRRRYAFALPSEVQRRGGNRLRLEFEPRRAARGEVAAVPFMTRWYSLSVGPAAHADLVALAREDAPPPLGIGQGPRSRALLQAGSSTVRFAFRAPGRAELRFTPDLQPRARAAGAAANFSVAVKQGGVEREIWRGRIVAGESAPEEVALDLPARAGEPAVLVLQVRPDDGRRPAWALWQGLRVLGDPQDVAAVAADSGGDGDVSRGDLADANVVLVVLDAAGAHHFGCYGYPRPTTPEIDRIAAEGIVYARAYSPAVFTRSAMASVWTSQYPDQHRVGVDENAGISPQRPTLAELLSARGVYAAGFIGNPTARSFGLDRGFAEFHSIYTQRVNVGRVTRAEAFRQVLPDWFQNHKAGRFFAYVHYLEPHFPYDPPAPFDTLFGPAAPLSLSQRRELDWLNAVNEGRIAPTPEQIDHLVRLYDGSLTYVDREVGFLRRTLEQAGLWDRTLFILSADHGEGLYEHGWIGHMKQVHEEAAHVPLIVRYPRGRGPAGSRIEEVVSLLDLAPTIADALGVAVPPGTFRGHSLLHGVPGTRVITRNTDLEATYGVTEDRYRLLYRAADRHQELYDVVADPAERRDLLDARSAWAAAQRQALQSFILGLTPESPAPVQPLSRPEREALRALGYVY